MLIATDKVAFLGHITKFSNQDIKGRKAFKLRERNFKTVSVKDKTVNLQATEAHKERRNNLKNSSSLLDGVLGQHHAPTALLQGKETPVSIPYESPFGPSGQENSLLPKLECWSSQRTF